jgi:hypothetical protein
MRLGRCLTVRRSCRTKFMPYEMESSGWLLFPPGQAWPTVEITVAAAMRVLQEDDPADIAALLKVDRIVGDRRLHEAQEVWAKTYSGIPVASAQQANAMAEIRASFINGFPEMLRQVISALFGARLPEDESPPGTAR